MRKFGAPFSSEMSKMSMNLLSNDGAVMEGMWMRQAIAAGLPEKFGIKPDTYGCDCIFLRYFINADMADDFPLIARDFLLHEASHIEEHENVEYLSVDTGVEYPELMFEHHVLNLMMNSLNSGSEYTKALFLELYKTYYKKEYKTLKRFNSICFEELLALGRPEGAEDDFYLQIQNLSRILFISRLMGIKIEPDCNVIYLDLDELNEFESRRANYTTGESFGELSQNCLKEIEENYDMKKLYSLDDKLYKFLGNVLEWAGYDPDIIEYCDDNDDGLMKRLCVALALFKKSYPNKEYKMEDIVLYGMIVHVVSAFCCNSDWWAEQLKTVTYGERGTDYYENFPSKFKAENLTSKSSDTAKVEKKEKPDKGTKKSDEDQYDKDELLNELDALRRKVHSLEKENQNLRAEASGKRLLEAEKTDMSTRLGSANRELSALRSYVYNLTEEDELNDENTIDEMKKTIEKYHIVIIGGHSNWVNKVKKEFPDWVFVSHSANSTLDVDVVNKADMVYFFTDTIGHSTYFRYINVIRERKIDFGYIHGVNLAKNISQIYHDLTE